MWELMITGKVKNMLKQSKMSKNNLKQSKITLNNLKLAK